MSAGKCHCNDHDFVRPHDTASFLSLLLFPLHAGHIGKEGRDMQDCALPARLCAKIFPFLVPSMLMPCQLSHTENHRLIKAGKDLQDTESSLWPNTTLPTKCHVLMFLAHSQGQWLYHLPGQPVARSDHLGVGDRGYGNRKWEMGFNKGTRIYEVAALRIGSLTYQILLWKMLSICGLLSHPRNKSICQFLKAPWRYSVSF